ncbi:MAG: hypothetical protein ABSH48_02305 [Verrucomicrobiota bacterium]|jgi:hypothetical protein
MNTSNQSHEEILAVLEAYGLDWTTFAALRSDSYEQKLAQHSPKQLDQFYSVLFSPGLTQTEQALECPPWPPGTKQSGAQPTTRILSEVACRWNTGRVLDAVSLVAKLVEKFRATASSLPNAQMDSVMDTLCAMLSHELLAAKLEGMRLSQQTKALAMLLRKRKLDSDVQAREQSLKDDQTKALELCLEEAKAFPEVQELFKAAFTALLKARSE